MQATRALVARNKGSGSSKSGGFRGREERGGREEGRGTGKVGEGKGGRGTGVYSGYIQSNSSMYLALSVQDWAMPRKSRTTPSIALCMASWRDR